MDYQRWLLSGLPSLTTTWGYLNTGTSVLTCANCACFIVVVHRFARYGIEIVPLFPVPHDGVLGIIAAICMQYFWLLLYCISTVHGLFFFLCVLVLVRMIFKNTSNPFVCLLIALCLCILAWIRFWCQSYIFILRSVNCKIKYELSLTFVYYFFKVVGLFISLQNDPI